MFFDSIRGADSGAAIYSITETAKLNELRPYKYLEYLLTELPKLCNDKGNIDITKLDPLMPWTDQTAFVTQYAYLAKSQNRITAQSTFLILMKTTK